MVSTMLAKIMFWPCYIYTYLRHLISIVLKSGPAWRVDLADPGLEPGRVDEKIGKVMTQCDPADPADPAG